MLLRAKSTKKGVRSEMKNILEKMSFEIIELVRTKQLSKGLDHSGEVIGVYSELTEMISKGRKKAGTPYDFQDTGDLFKNFDYSFKKGQIEIFSTDDKVEDLKEKYDWEGGKLFVLSEEHQKVLNYDMIKPILVSFIKKNLKV